jgi:foldase protein PrsA
VDSQEVLDFFDKHKEEFYVQEQILVHHIVISPYGLKKGKDSLNYKNHTTEELDEAARQIAYDLRARIDSKESFEEIARHNSHDEFSARKGGQIDWAPRGFYAWPFDSLAFSAKVGDIVGPYRDKDGWQILYIDDYIPAGIPELNDQIYQTSLQRVLSEKTREISFAIFDTLFDEMNLKYNEELYDTNSYFVDKPVWAAVVNETDTIDFGELSSGEEQVREIYKVPNSTPEMKKELVRFLARRWAMAQEARRMKLDTLPEVVNEIETQRHYYSRLIVWSKRIDMNWEPSEEEMRAYYDSNTSKYVVEKPLKVQHILVNDLTLAEFLRDQANAGVDFLKLADEYYIGEKAVRRDLANLGAIGPNDVSKEFFDAARAVRAGEVSKPVKTEYGYHIIKVLEANWSTPFENARSEIRVALKKQHEAEEIEQFKAGLFKEFNLKKTGNLSPLHFKPRSDRETSA